MVERLPHWPWPAPPYGFPDQQILPLLRSGRNLYAPGLFIIFREVERSAARPPGLIRRLAEPSGNRGSAQKALAVP